MGKPAFSRSLPFSELKALQLLTPYITASLKYRQCQVVSVEEGPSGMTSSEGNVEWSTDKAEASEPGTPAVQFWNV